MLEVHAILQRQRCNENITKKTGTLSDAYFLVGIIFYTREVFLTESKGFMEAVNVYFIGCLRI